MKRLFFSVAMLLAYSHAFSQSILEQFEDETANATTFTANGTGFTIGGGKLTVTTFGGNYGVGPTAFFVDNNSNCLTSAGVIGSIYTTAKQGIIVDTIYLFPSADCSTISVAGNEVIQGYKNGSLVSTYTLLGTSMVSTVSGRSNGFTKVATPFSSNAVDSIVFSCTGSLRYVAIDQFVFRKVTNTWTGASNTSWTNKSNWSDNSIPTTWDDVNIPGSLSNYPVITSGTASCHDITTGSGASITVNGGTLQISGTVNFTTSGPIDATNGTIVLNGASYSGYLSLTSTSPTTFPATQQIFYGVSFTGNTVKDFVLNNTSGSVLYTTLSITGTYTPTAGQFDGILGSSLTLKSSASGTARIAAGSSSGGYFSGNFPIKVEQYIPGGRRAFRFLAHPYASSIALSQLTDNIDITGSGGSTNGFTTTGTNNPSSYWYNVATGNGSTTNDPGWTAFTSTNGSGANSWDKAEGLRVLLRGAKGEGLTAGTYTPSAVTLDMSANVINQGNQTISLTKGSGTSFVIVGNPFPSQIDLNQTTGRTNVGSSFFVWNANQGTRGAYQSNLFSSSYILPAYTSFVTTLSGNGSITFPESCKSSSTANSLLKTTATPNMVQLRIEDSTIFWDRLLLRFDDNALSAVDYDDAGKMTNPDVNFYSFSKDDSTLSIDTRPYADGEIIPLGINSPLEKNFKIVVSDFDIPAGATLILHDKYLNTTTSLQAGTEYWFAINSDTLSQGNSRFELNVKGVPSGINYTALPGDELKVKIVPNPAQQHITIHYKSVAGNKISVRIIDMMGKVVHQTGVIEVQNEKTEMPVSYLQKGLYIVEITNGRETIKQKLIKQ